MHFLTVILGLFVLNSLQLNSIYGIKVVSNNTVKHDLQGEGSSFDFIKPYGSFPHLPLIFYQLLSPLGLSPQQSHGVLEILQENHLLHPSVHLGSPYYRNIYNDERGFHFQPDRSTFRPSPLISSYYEPPFGVNLAKYTYGIGPYNLYGSIKIPKPIGLYKHTKS